MYFNFLLVLTPIPSEGFSKTPNGIFKHARKVVLEPNTQFTIFPLPPTPSKQSKPHFGPPSTVQISIREGLGRKELGIWQKH